VATRHPRDTTHAIYVFGTAFNAQFLAHVALLELAAVALVLTLRSLDLDGLAARFGPRTPARWVSGLLAFLAVALGGMWTYYALRPGRAVHRNGHADRSGRPAGRTPPDPGTALAANAARTEAQP
jgi:hypothetical protein